MKKHFENYNINISDEKIEKFEKFYQLLIEYNQKFNITAITNREEVIEILCKNLNKKEKIKNGLYRQKDT